MVAMVRGPKGQGNKSLPHTVETVCASLCSERHPADPGSVELNSRSVQVCQCGFDGSVSRSDSPALCSVVCIHDGIRCVLLCVHIIIVHGAERMSTRVCGIWPRGWLWIRGGSDPLPFGAAGPSGNILLLHARGLVVPTGFEPVAFGSANRRSVP